ncbi:MAG: ribosome small subunit-dependent GTPase A [bacterium]
MIVYKNSMSKNYLLNGSGDADDHDIRSHLKKGKHSNPRDENKHLNDLKAAFVVSLKDVDVTRIGIVSNVFMRKIEVLFENKFHNCVIDNKLPKEVGKGMVVGDKVTLKEIHGKNFIDHLIERKSVLSRLKSDSTRTGGGNIKSEQIIAANIDSAVIVASAKNPPLHPGFIDRYLVVLQHNNIEPIICINKADLGIKNEEILDIYKKIGIKIVKTSVESALGIEELKKLIKNKTAVLVGNSGVGKSSLINAITAQSNSMVGSVSLKTGKGKHTTTSSDLFPWAENSYIIDTPGIRALEIIKIDKRDLKYYFNEIAKYSTDCKYTDCAHHTENDCGVKVAVKDGSISQQRYNSYLKILRGELED